MRPTPLAIALTFFIPAATFAGGIQGNTDIQTVVVQADATQQIGLADSATEGTVTGKQIENRPIERTAEMLEVIPGVIVTQHSGDGKANQYFLRGFNLDHGTDFRTTIMGMPVNMPTHAHGQGYADLNFLIPELVRTIKYKKGPYYADEGDFSAAGAAAFDYVRTLPAPFVSLEAGQNDYRRALLAGSADAGPGSLLYAVEEARNNGPWDLPEHYRRHNGVLSYSWKHDANDVRLTAMAMQSSWRSTDQVPERAIDAGLIDRFGAIDPSDGGNNDRYSLSGEWAHETNNGAVHANAYLIRSRLDLFSDFTYFLNDPVHGDQFEQAEHRTTTGLNVDRNWSHQLAGHESTTTVGLQVRHDRLDPVGLYATEARQRLSTTREDRVDETSASLFISNDTQWTSRLRSVIGVRSDHYRFDVASDNPANSGNVDAAIASPKFSGIYRAGKNVELYANWGRGFHSNDARGIVQTVDPVTGTPIAADGTRITQATPLAKAIGREAGARFVGLVPGLQTSVALWQLNIASELVFEGDTGTTSASRPSRRTGIEIANYYTPAPGWIVDADLAWSHPRFADDNPAGSYIPEAIERTASLGATWDLDRWSGGLRVRYFGGRPLIEDNSVRSHASTLVNAKIGYALNKRVKVTAEALNLFDRRVNDIDYYYASRLPAESAAVDDVHLHPAEPRTLRLGIIIGF